MWWCNSSVGKDCVCLVWATAGTSCGAAMRALQTAKLQPSFVAASTLKQIQHRNLAGNEMASD